MTAKLHSIHRFPIKGLTGERLDTVHLRSGAGLPGDRAYAIAKGSVAREGAPDHWVPKENFVQLTDVPRLAKLESGVDPDTDLLTIKRNGKQVCRGNLSSPVGLTGIDDFLTAFLKNDVAGKTRIVHARGYQFTDAKGAYLSLINLDSVNDFSRRIAKTEIDPRRFRANLWMEGLAPWTELEWVPGTRITLGDARLRVVGPIPRCAATDVNPDSTARDVNIPRLLRVGLRHEHLGVYLTLENDSTLSVGDEIRSLELPETPPTELSPAQ